MKSSLSLSVLAACAALAAVALPATSHAAKVGYITGCYYGGEEGRPEIVAAGHEAVALPSYEAITSDQLVGLSTVLATSCWRGTNAAVDAAVAAGMSLLVHDNENAPNAGDRLPGSYVFGVSDGSSSADVNFNAAAPFLSGPGGTLNNGTLDGGSSSNHGTVPAASLAPGIRILATGTSATEVIILDYAYGNGRVVYSTIPLSCYLTGGGCAGEARLSVVSAGMQAYTKNLVAAYAGPSFTTCAAAGYTSAKLTMCRSICETTQSSTTLTNKIKLYTAIYREAPPCGR